MIDVNVSPPLDIMQGVPEGSILGPLLYVLYTSDAPDLAHHHHITITRPTPYCQECGSIVSYIDDSSYSVGRDGPTELTDSLTIQYSEISTYMSANQFVINDDKTHLMVFGNRRIVTRRNEVSLLAGNHTVDVTETERLLGAHISQDLK